MKREDDLYLSKLWKPFISSLKDCRKSLSQDSIGCSLGTRQPQAFPPVCLLFPCRRFVSHHQFSAHLTLAACSPGFTDSRSTLFILVLSAVGSVSSLKEKMQNDKFSYIRIGPFCSVSRPTGTELPYSSFLFPIHQADCSVY